MIDIIENLGMRYALIIRRDFRQEGIVFFTDSNTTMQMGYMSRPAGYNIEPHVHTPVCREVKYTYEVLFVRTGAVRVNFYDEDEKFFQATTLFQGDVILLERGGHGFEFLEPSELIEVKQGPYAGTEDKRRFTAK